MNDFFTQVKSFDDGSDSGICEPRRNRHADAADLVPGDRLADTHGRASQLVTAVRTWTGLHWMYNFTVADIHTYYVIAGTTPVLVHNCGGARFAVDSKGVVTDLDANPLRGTRYTDKVNVQIESGDDHAFPALVDELPTCRDATVETGRDGNSYTHVRPSGIQE